MSTIRTHLIWSCVVYEGQNDVHWWCAGLYVSTEIVARSSNLSLKGSSRSGLKFSQLEMSVCTIRTLHVICTSTDRFGFAEVVLATLIPAFSFELTEKPIEWNCAGVAYPSVGESFKPEMPLRVARLNV